MNEHVEIDAVNAATMMATAHVDAGDDRLVIVHRTLKRIAKARAQLDLREAEALREAQTLQLWKQFACTSLADYMVQQLGYSSWRTAEDRLRLANALPELPKITEAIQNGELNMSQARELARVATPETEQKWIEKALDLNVRQVEQAVAWHAKGDLPEDPIDPRLVRKTMWLSIRPETEVLFREARRVLEKERGEKLDDDAVIETMCRAVLRASDRSDRSTHVGGERAPERAATADRPDQSTHVGDVGEPVLAAGEHDGRDDHRRDRPDQSTHVGGGRFTAAAGAAYRIAVMLCKGCRRGWQHGAGSLVEMSPPAVERAMCDAQWIGDLDSPIVERARQDITPATRRKVLQRDQFRCRVPGCHCYTNLDVHHIVHREHGGTHELSNILCLCEAHHLAHHAGTLVIARNGDDVTFRFEGRNNFTRKAREVATKEALRERGLDRTQVKAIMIRTINTVGDSDLSEPQWLAIALRYVNELAS
jgi:hypothetical protein